MVVGTDSPPFDFDREPGEIDRMVERIHRLGASVLVVGLARGAPGEVHRQATGTGSRT